MDADLHIHTTVSDGCLSPKEAVRLAKEINLEVLSITDHDTMGGISEALAEGEKLKIKVIPGVEMSTEYKNKDIHILGYFVDQKNENFQILLEHLRKARQKRVKNIIKKLNGLGCKVNLDEVSNLAREGSVGRPHIARVLAQKGYVNSVKDAFERFIGFNAPAYVERYKLLPKEVIELVLKAGGVPVLAHPGLIKNDSLIYEIINEGLKGLEVFHPEHNEEEVQKLEVMALKNKLLITGGSDCHGIDSRTGSQLGRVTVSMYHVKKLEQAAREIKRKNQQESLQG
ncbi:PHP domain-containing protein [Candidatus Contubernalis alkaliaceticus]|uniref:PHP domain-containing protein n=1 Tax=Candidatus Contubernalis alkaliaceticus TaxID=338645 RepID=UPI001F4BCFCB|nr:PHP domain-containing protein [Candidatus Contubernalis alkalaceticus]UNC91873.1 PHP domain-containing protein [Candidatus Contubernalis alkalaceticus]